MDIDDRGTGRNGSDEAIPGFRSQEELDVSVGKIESDMRAANRFEFEKAAKLWDTIKELWTKEFLFA